MSANVSVILLSHNSQDFLKDSIESVLAQTYKDYELIVIDNGSTDGSWNIIRSYGDRIRAIQQDNQGKSGGYNRGFMESRGQFLAFLDADDVWHPQKLERQIAVLNNYGIGMVYCGVQKVDQNLEHIEILTPARKGGVLNSFALDAAPVVPGGISGVLVRKTCLNKVGLLDTQIQTTPEWDLFRRIACNFEIDFIEDPLLISRQHGGNIHHDLKAFEKDVNLRLDKMFSDPSAAMVHHLKRKSFALANVMLARNYAKQFRYLNSLRCFLKGILYWPGVIFHQHTMQNEFVVPYDHMPTTKKRVKVKERDI